MTMPTLVGSRRPPPPPNIYQPNCQIDIRSTWKASGKACQLREKQATKLENANKMEQQRLKQIANKKERDCVRKKEVLEQTML